MMQKIAAVLLIVGLVAGIVAGYVGAFAVYQPQVSQLETDLSAKNAELTELGWIAGPPPASLDKLYPPQAPGPIYLGTMFEMAGPFGGIVVDLQEQDFENVMKNYALFREKYIEASQLVPEWENEFDIDKVDALGSALESGDGERSFVSQENEQLLEALGGALKSTPPDFGTAGEMMEAVGGEVCLKCHWVHNPAAAAKERWEHMAEE